MSYINRDLTGSLSPFGTVGLPNLSVSQIYSMNQSTGDHALFTVPTGKKALCVVTVHNTSVGAIACTPKMSFDGGSTFIQVNGSTSPASNATSGAIVWGFIGSAGDVFGLTTATNNGANIVGEAYVFDAGSPIKTVKLTTLTDGNNTLYTCPAGKTAYTVFGYGNILSASATSPFIEATTTATVTIKFNVVLNGGSVATTNQIYTASLATLSNGPGAFLTLTPGDFININTSAGANTPLAWVTVLEQ